MSLNEMLAKNNPIGINRKTSESDYEKLVDRNTELFDELKEKEEEINRLKNLCDQYEEEHNTMFVKWQEDIKRMIKAIKHIKENYSNPDGEIWHKDIEKILNILKGSDKE